MKKKPKCFISYARKNGRKAPWRLALALEPYCSEVFWDWKLRAGDWKKQLAQKITSADFFLVFVSPEQSQSEMCQWELGLAQGRCKEDERFKIIPIKQFGECQDEELAELQYVNFVGEFEMGFSDLNQLMFGERRYSWEHLISESPEAIVSATRKGLLPAPIVFSACERLIINKIWNHINEMISSAKVRFFVGNPQTPEDVLIQIDRLIPQLEERGNAAGVIKLQRARKMVGQHIERAMTISSNDHQSACQNACELIATINQFLQEEAVAHLDAVEVINIDANYAPDVVSALRKAMKEYARSAHI